MKKLILALLFCIILLLGLYVYIIVNTKSDENKVMPASQKTMNVESSEEEQAEVLDDSAMENDVIELSSTQQSLASSLGYSIDRIELTPDILDCVTDKVGSARVEEMINGSSPGPLEMAKLAKCLP